jgi:hypothetical protein
MKRLMLALVTFSFSASVAGGWVTFMKTDNSVVYIDSTTVRKEGSLRKALVLVDLAVKDDNGARSKRGQSEIDCQGDRMRIHDLSGFSGGMASGEAVYSFKGSGEWIPIPPQTALWNTIKLICSR